MHPRGQAVEIVMKEAQGRPFERVGCVACTLKVWESADATLVVGGVLEGSMSFSPLAK